MAHKGPLTQPDLICKPKQPFPSPTPGFLSNRPFSSSESLVGDKSAHQSSSTAYSWLPMAVVSIPIQQISHISRDPPSCAFPDQTTPPAVPSDTDPSARSSRHCKQLAPNDCPGCLHMAAGKPKIGRTTHQAGHRRRPRGQARAGRP